LLGVLLPCLTLLRLLDVLLLDVLLLLPALALLRLLGVLLPCSTLLRLLDVLLLLLLLLLSALALLLAPPLLLLCRLVLLIVLTFLCASRSRDSEYQEQGCRCADNSNSFHNSPLALISCALVQSLGRGHSL
jgi:hypothetical protein